MDRQSNKLKTLESVGAAVAMTAGAAENSRVRGYYQASLLRVDDEFRAEAEELSGLIKIAEQMKAEQEVARLVARLQALPRHEVWTDKFANLVTDAGAKDLLDKYLGLAAQTNVYMGLKGVGTALVTETMGAHAAWSEVGGTNAPAYTGVRPTPAFSAASGTGAGSRTKATSSAVNFVFTSGGTVAGCFLVLGGSSTKDNTTGILFSAGDFTGGNKTVANTDQLNVTYSLAV